MSIDDYLPRETERTQQQSQAERARYNEVASLLRDFKPVGRRLFEEAVARGLEPKSDPDGLRHFVLDDHYGGGDYPFRIYADGTLDVHGSGRQLEEKWQIQQLFSNNSRVRLAPYFNPKGFVYTNPYSSSKDTPLDEWIARDMARRIAEMRA